MLILPVPEPGILNQCLKAFRLAMHYLTPTNSAGLQWHLWGKGRGRAAKLAVVLVVGEEWWWGLVLIPGPFLER